MAVLVGDWCKVAQRQRQVPVAGTLGGAGWGDQHGTWGQRPSPLWSSVAVRWNWSWEETKPSYCRGQGHPLPNCDSDKCVLSLGKGGSVSEASKWGVTDAGMEKAT